jgi:hypothetical protein
MSLATDLSLFSSTTYPNRGETDPAKKTPAWIRQYAAAGVTEFMRSQASWLMWAHDPTIADNLAYALGEQDTGQYRRFSGGAGVDRNSIKITNRDGHFESGDDGAQVYHRRSGGGGGDTDPMALDSIIKATPLAILPVKLDALESTIVERGYEVDITALGQKADQEKKDHEALMRFWMEQGSDFRAAGIVPPAGLPDPMPATEPELKTYLDNWQVEAAAALERKLRICAIESGLEQILSDARKDVLRHGYTCLADFQQPGKRPISKHIPVQRGMFPHSAYADYRDMTMGGYWEVINHDTLMAEVNNNNRLTSNREGKNWTREDRQALKQLAMAGLPNNILDDVTQSDKANTGALKVVRWYFLTDDDWAEETYQAEDGSWKKKKAKADQPGPTMKGGEINKATINCLYECMLICGTALAYNCRKVLDQGRDLHNPNKAKMPFSITAPMMASNHAVSVTKNAKTIIDEIERSYRAYMAVKRTYTPEGNNYPPDLLGAMAAAMHIEGDNPEQAALRYIKQTGDSHFPNVNPDTSQPLQNPITANPHGIPPAMLQHMTDVFQQYQLLEMMTGANAVLSAATPQGDAMGKGVNQIAVQGAANIMSNTRDGLKRCYENHVRNLAGRIWLTEQDTPVTGTVKNPDGSKTDVGPYPKLHEYGFFMDVQLGPAQEEKDRLEQSAQLATQGPTPQLNYDDYLHVCWLIKGNLKTAQQYMAVAVSRKRRQDEEKAAKLQQQNGDISTQTAQAAAQAQMQADAAKHQQAMEKAQFDRETSWGITDRQNENQRLIAQNNTAAKVEVAHITELGQAVRTDVNNQHALQHTALQAALEPEPEPAAA